MNNYFKILQKVHLKHGKKRYKILNTTSKPITKYVTILKKKDKTLLKNS